MTTNIQPQELERAERFKKEAQFSKDLKDSLVRLNRNKDFKRITAYLFDTRVKQLSKELGRFLPEKTEENVIATLKGISVIQRILTDIIEEGNGAEYYLSLTDEQLIAMFNGDNVDE